MEVRKTLRTNADIAKRNDLYRTCMIPAPTFRLVLTEVVAFLRDEENTKFQDLITAVREFKFDPNDKGNNPHGENDFGSVEVGGKTYYFKFDYYAPDMIHGADPYNDPLVIHVLTLMDASEY